MKKSLLLITFILSMFFVTVLASCNTSVVESLLITNKDDLMEAVSNWGQVKVSVKYSGKDYKAASSYDVEFSVSDENIITIDKDGRVKVISEGNVTITVISKKKNKQGEYIKEEVADVRVLKAVESIEIFNKEMFDEPITSNDSIFGGMPILVSIKYLGGEKFVAASEYVLYTSGDDSILTVSEPGYITGVRNGSTTVTVITKDNDVYGVPLSDTVQVTIDIKGLKNI